MVAATWSDQFDLNVETSAISAGLEPKGFGDIDGDTVLKCLSAIHNKGIKKEQVLSLRTLNKPQMDALVRAGKEALLKTVDILTTEFRIHSWDFLPYEAYAVILSYIFAKRGRLSAEDIGRVRQWFWTSAFSERYRGASEHFVSRDLEEIDRFVIGAGENVSFGSPPSPSELVRLSFRANNSRSRAYILLLAGMKPRNLTNGIAIDPAEALSVFNKKQFHHIYPKAHLSRVGEENKQNSLMNICMLAASENNWLSDGDPSQYVPEVTQALGAHASAIFASNLLPDPLQVNYSFLSFDEFLASRAEIVHPVIVSVCEGRVI